MRTIEGPPSDFKRRYYEQAAFWDFDYAEVPAERQRIEAAIALIPPGVESLLDAGCGNGALLNALAAGQGPRIERLVGLDRSREALRRVRAPTLLGSIDAIPFADGSFDLVSALEVIEHLPEGEFARALGELRRVSRRHIMIAVPNREDLDRSLVACPACRCRFNPHFHMRAFDPDSLRTLLEGFRRRMALEVGPESKTLALGPAAIALLRALRPRTPPPTAICPQCGHQSAPADARTGASTSMPGSRSRLALAARSLLPQRRKRRWLMAIYDRI